MLKAIGYDLLPPNLSHAERFAMAARAGFTHVEPHSEPDPAAAEEVRAAAEATGIKIPSVVALTPNAAAAYLVGPPEKVTLAITAVHKAIDNAVLWDADTVLLVAGLVDEQTPYEEAYACSQRAIRESILPLADQKNITLGIENAWYGFLLTPTEYVRYIDECESPRVRAYVDVGNMIFGYPQHWVRSTGSRIVSVHIKDYDSRRLRWGTRGAFCPIGEGNVDWRAVRRAFNDVGYDGCFVSTAVPMNRLLHPIERVSRSPYRRFLPPPAINLLRQYERRVYPPFLADLSRRFDWFQSLS